MITQKINYLFKNNRFFILLLGFPIFIFGWFWGKIKNYISKMSESGFFESIENKSIIKKKEKNPGVKNLNTLLLKIRQDSLPANPSFENNNIQELENLHIKPIHSNKNEKDLDTLRNNIPDKGEQNPKILNKKQPNLAIHRSGSIFIVECPICKKKSDLREFRVDFITKVVYCPICDTDMPENLAEEIKNILKIK